MKTNILLKSITLTFILLLSGSLLMAQSKEKKEHAEQEAAMEAEMKAKKEMLEQQEHKMRQMEIRYEDQSRSAERAARSSARTYVRSSGAHPDSYYVIAGEEQNNQSQLTLRNSFDGNSNTSKGGFEVSEETHNFRVMINGKVKSGEIQIIVKYPNGKEFKNLTINSAAEITYSQSLTLKEGEESKYIGTWNYEVKATFAEGNYMLQMMTH
jgi:hypothetical protein